MILEAILAPLGLGWWPKAGPKESRLESEIHRSILELFFICFAPMIVQEMIPKPIKIQADNLEKLIMSFFYEQMSPFKNCDFDAK